MELVKILTNIRKSVEYYINLCYYLIENSKENEVINMIGTMPSLYNQVIEKGKGQKEKMSLIKCISCYKRLKKLANKTDFSKYIESNSEVLDGKFVIKNTRIQPEIIFYYFANKCEEIDDSEKIMEMIKENYPSLNDEEILMSFLYVIKEKGIKAFL